MFIYVYLCLSMFIYVYLCLSMFIYVYLGGFRRGGPEMDGIMMGYTVNNTIRMHDSWVLKNVGECCKLSLSCRS